MLRCEGVKMLGCEGVKILGRNEAEWHGIARNGGRGFSYLCSVKRQVREREEFNSKESRTKLEGDSKGDCSIWKALS